MLFTKGKRNYIQLKSHRVYLFCLEIGCWWWFSNDYLDFPYFLNFSLQAFDFFLFVLLISDRTKLILVFFLLINQSINLICEIFCLFVCRYLLKVNLFVNNWYIGNDMIMLMMMMMMVNKMILIRPLFWWQIWSCFFFVFCIFGKNVVCAFIPLLQQCLFSFLPKPMVLEYKKDENSINFYTFIQCYLHDRHWFSTKKKEIVKSMSIWVRVSVCVPYNKKSYQIQSQIFYFIGLSIFWIQKKNKTCQHKFHNQKNKS